MYSIILWHAAFPYVPGIRWPVHNTFANEIAGKWVYGTIGFMVCVFFVISGYFARQALQSRGLVSAILDRLLRIGVPLALFSVLASYFFNWFIGYRFFRILPWDLPFAFPVGVAPHHLWFLNYLLYISIGFALIIQATKYVPMTLPGLFEKVLVGLSAKWWSIPLLGLPTAALFYVAGSDLYLAQAGTSFTPDPAAFTHFLLFFLFGWSMNWKPAILANISRLGPFLLITGALLRTFTVVYWWDSGLSASDNLFSDLVSAAMNSLYSWLVVLGLIGTVFHFSTANRKTYRFLADSSYWSYLFHLIPLIIVQHWFANSELRASMSYVITSLLTIGICIVSYRYLVRYTLIGRLLNGPRQRSIDRSSGHFPG